MAVRVNQFSLRALFVVMTIMAVICGVIVGGIRFGNGIVRMVEREHWQDKIADGDYKPDKYPANLFTAQELAELKAKRTQTIGNSD